MRVSLTYGKLTIQQQERMEQPMKKVSLRNTCLMWSTTMIPPSHVLFLYYAPHIVHAPLQVPEKYLNMFSFIDDHDQQYYHATVTFLDGVVGNLMEALKKRGLWIIYCL